MLDWGNIDFDVNLVISDAGRGSGRAVLLRIFNTDGFLGDQILVNFAYKPFMEVLPRKYRFRILNACMSRFIKLALVERPGPDRADDGHCHRRQLPAKAGQRHRSSTRRAWPSDSTSSIDFKGFAVGQPTSHHQHARSTRTGAARRARVSVRHAMTRQGPDPGVGPVLEFRIVDQVESVERLVRSTTATDPDHSRVPAELTTGPPVVRGSARTVHRVQRSPTIPPMTDGRLLP